VRHIGGLVLRVLFFGANVLRSGATLRRYRTSRRRVAEKRQEADPWRLSGAATHCWREATGFVGGAAIGSLVKEGTNKFLARQNKTTGDAPPTYPLI
jgi:hypothetical protein